MNLETFDVFDLTIKTFGVFDLKSFGKGIDYLYGFHIIDICGSIYWTCMCVLGHVCRSLCVCMH